MTTVTLTEEEVEIIVVALTRESAVTVWSIADAISEDDDILELKARTTMIGALMEKLKAARELAEGCGESGAWEAEDDRIERQGGMG